MKVYLGNPNLHLSLLVRAACCRLESMILIFILALLPHFGVFAQGPTITLGDSIVCQPGSLALSVPLRVQQFNGIGAISLDIRYDSLALTYTSFGDAAVSGNLIVNSPRRGRVLISWFSLIPASLPNGSLLMRLRFQGDSTTQLQFNFQDQLTELANELGDVIQGAVFNSGWVVIGGVQIIQQPPMQLPLNLDSSATISVESIGDSLVRWQVIPPGGGWTDLSDGADYFGTSTKALRITARSGFNGNLYRARFVARGGCAPAQSNACTLQVTSFNLPTVISTSATAISQTIANVGGLVNSDGGTQVTNRGVVYAVTSSPSMTDSIRSSGTGTGSFVVTLSQLIPNTQYFYRAFATNILGTAYGNLLNFRTMLPNCPPLVTDRQGNQYQTVSIFNQCWFQNNLKVSTYRNGDTIPSSLSNTQWSNDNLGACAAPSNQANYLDNFGRLYNGFAVRDVRGICPVGWRVPSEADFDTLTNRFGGNFTAGGALKQNAFWVTPNMGATNQSGFTARPGGQRASANGDYGNFGSDGYWWTSSGATNNAWYRRLNYNSTSVTRAASTGSREGFSVRCLLGESNISPPSVSTLGVFGITHNRAIVQGQVLADGGFPVIRRGIQYYFNSNLSQSNFTLPPHNHSGVGIYSVNLSGPNIFADTIYYYRAFAENVVGSGYGLIDSFRTLAAPPLVPTVIAGSVFACSGQTVEIPFYVQNFNQIGSGNLRFAFRRNAASFVGLRSTVLDTGSLQFNLRQDPTAIFDTLSIFWTSSPAISLNYNTIIFRLAFLTIGSTPLIWDMQPSNFEITNASGQGIDAVLEDGDIYIRGLSDTIRTALCAPDFLIFGGDTLRQSGNYVDVLPSSIGCDSLVILQLTVRQPSNVNLQANICAPATFVFNGTELTTTGIYRDTLVNVSGCDSIITLNLAVNEPSDTLHLNRSICAPASISVGNNTFNATGIYTVNLVNLFGCDSVVVLNLMVTPQLDSVFLVSQICEPDTFSIGQSSFSVTGIYTVSILGSNGCDSVVVLDLIVNNIAERIIDTTVCLNQSVNFGGQVISQAGTYTDTSLGFQGCDSITILHLTFSDIIRDTLVQRICAPSSFVFYGINYQTTGTYAHTIPATFSGACDTVLVLELQVGRPSDTIWVNDTICQGERLQIGPRILQTTGTYTIELVNSEFCDSVVVVNLLVLPVLFTELYDTLCAPASTFFAGQIRTISGTYTDTFTTTSGCDSVVLLLLVVNQPNFTQLTDTICAPDSVIFNGQARSVSGIYRDTLTNSLGCDSVVSLVLLVTEQERLLLVDTLCYPNVYVFGDSIIGASGSYSRIIPGQNGSCDTTIDLQLWVHPYVNPVSIDTSICFDQGFSVGSNVYRSSGNYVDTLVNSRGCDSIVYLNLLVHPRKDSVIFDTICAGNAILFGGVLQFQSGIYLDTLVDYIGCDSVVELRLTVDGVAIIGTSSDSLVVYDGRDATFQVQASDAQLYRWQILQGGIWVDLIDDTVYNGVTTESLTLHSRLALHGSIYRVVVAGISCSDTSVVFRLNVIPTRVPSALIDSIFDIGATSAVIEVRIYDDGGQDVIQRGVVYAEQAIDTNLRVVQWETNDGTGMGVFVSQLTYLQPSTLYYVRPYAENALGRAYGSELTFTTLATDLYQVTLKVSNQEIPDTYTYEFDVFASNSGLNSVKVRDFTIDLGIDTAVFNGGQIQVEVVNQSSDLSNSAQKLTNSNLSIGAISQPTMNGVYRFIQLRLNYLPGIDSNNASHIPAVANDCSAPGVRLARIRLLNSVPFKDGSRPNHVFSIESANGQQPSNLGVFSSILNRRNLVSGGGLLLYNFDTDSTCDRNLPFGFIDIGIRTFIEGYYQSSRSSMRAVLFQAGRSTNPAATDSLILRFWRPNNLLNPLILRSAILDTSGNAWVSIPAYFTGDSCYLSLDHRSSLDIWSAQPISIEDSLFIDFSTDSLSAHSTLFAPPPMRFSGGKWMMYSGDVNKDGTIDGIDIISVWRKTRPGSQPGTIYDPGNLNGDNFYDTRDIFLVAQHLRLLLNVSRPH